MKIQVSFGRLLQLISLTALATVSVASTYPGTIEMATVTGTAQNNSLPPTFSAIYRYSHSPSATMLDSARVVVSEAGLRIDQVFDDSGNALVANFETNQLWFLDSQRELVHEVPIVMTDSEGEAKIDQMDGLYPGFIQFAPCLGMQAEFGENLMFHGHAITSWRCHVYSNDTASDDAVLEQLFSTRLGVVVWSQDADGFLSELVDVRLREANTGIFRPPSHYRDVELDELMHGSSAIERYQDPGEDRN